MISMTSMTSMDADGYWILDIGYWILDIGYMIYDI